MKFRFFNLVYHLAMDSLAASLTVFLENIIRSE